MIQGQNKTWFAAQNQARESWKQIGNCREKKEFVDKGCSQNDTEQYITLIKSRQESLFLH